MAEALTHTVWRDATIAIGITDHAVATGELTARSIVDPTKVSGDDQIKAGLHLLELEAALGRELDEATLSGLGIPPAADNAPAPTGNKKPEQNAEEDPYAKWMRLIGEGPASAGQVVAALCGGRSAVDHGLSRGTCAEQDRDLMGRRYVLQHELDRHHDRDRQDESDQPP